MKFLARIILAAGFLALTSCPKPQPAQPENPNGDLGDLPWNRQAPGEGAGALQQALNPY